MEKLLQNLGLTQDPNNPFAVPPPKLTEIVLRGAGAAAGRLPPANTFLGRFINSLAGFGGGISQILAEEAAARRRDPLSRQLAIGQAGLEAARGLTVREPGTTLPIEPPPPITTPGFSLFGGQKVSPEGTTEQQLRPTLAGQEIPPGEVRLPSLPKPQPSLFGPRERPSINIPGTTREPRTRKELMAAAEAAGGGRAARISAALTVGKLPESSFFEEQKPVAPGERGLVDANTGRVIIPPDPLAARQKQIQAQLNEEKLAEVGREKAFFDEASNLDPADKDYARSLIALQTKHKIGSGKDVVNQFLTLTSKEALEEYRTLMADFRERIAQVRESLAETKQPISLESYRKLADQAAVTGDAIDANVRLPSGEVVKMSNRTPGGTGEGALPRIISADAITNVLNSVVRNPQFASLSDNAKRQAIEEAANQAGHTFKSGGRFIIDPLSGYKPSTFLGLGGATFDIKTASPLPLQRQPKRARTPQSTAPSLPSGPPGTKSGGTWEDFKKMKELQ